MDHRTRRALQPNGLPTRASESHCRHASWAAGPSCSRWSSVTSTGTLPAAAAAAAARACAASIAFRALTILLYSSTGVGCIRSGSIRISGTQSARNEVSHRPFCCRALAIADCRSAVRSWNAVAGPIRCARCTRAELRQHVGRPGHHRGQPINTVDDPGRLSTRSLRSWSGRSPNAFGCRSIPTNCRPQ